MYIYIFRCGQDYVNLMWKRKRTTVARRILKKNRVAEIHLPNLKSDCVVTIIVIMCYQWWVRHVDHGNREPRHTHKHGHTNMPDGVFENMREQFNRLG